MTSIINNITTLLNSNTNSLNNLIPNTLSNRPSLIIPSNIPSLIIPSLNIQTETDIQVLNIIRS